MTIKLDFTTKYPLKQLRSELRLHLPIEHPIVQALKVKWFSFDDFMHYCPIPFGKNHQHFANQHYWLQLIKCGLHGHCLQFIIQQHAINFYCCIVRFQIMVYYLLTNCFIFKIRGSIWLQTHFIQVLIDRTFPLPLSPCLFVCRF